MSLRLFNTLTRKEEEFTPADPKNVRMYVCGPTVYDKPHIGNARSVVVYDVLYRLLRHLYGEAHVTYARNITDVDDKINDAAKKNGETIRTLTTRVTEGFHADMRALGCLNPNHEPRATDFVNASGTAPGKKETMVAMIERLIAGGHAYAADGHVLFDVTSYKDYGALSGRTVEEQQAGARIAVEGYKRHPGDFVLWKPADAQDDSSSVFESPWGPGRPGWHIECSVMSSNYLGADFDIHGGGADLMFPHHENEIAQSRCANQHSHFAKYWVHNGFLTVNGEKMSKSLGNFVTVRELLDKGLNGLVIRCALLSTHYRKPLDFSDKALDDAKKTMDALYKGLKDYDPKTFPALPYSELKKMLPIKNVVAAMCNDVNMSSAMAHLLRLAKPVPATAEDFEVLQKVIPNINLLQQHALYFGLSMLGLVAPDFSYAAWFPEREQEADPEIQGLVDARNAAKAAKNWAEADRIREALKSQGIVLEDKPGGNTEWRRA